MKFFRQHVAEMQRIVFFAGEFAGDTFIVRNKFVSVPDGQEIKRPSRWKYEPIVVNVDVSKAWKFGRSIE